VSSTPTLREGVRRTYSAIADDPAREHPFPVGRAYAISLGYDEDVLDRLPKTTWDAFAGVSCLPAFAALEPGDRVLDLGCGAGLDTLIAAEAIGAMGRVTAVDFSASMLERTRIAASQAGATNVDCIHSDAEALPLADASFDKALVNGIFNLNTDRAAIFRELARVMRPGGEVYAAELVLSGPRTSDAPADETEWFR